MCPYRKKQWQQPPLKSRAGQAFFWWRRERIYLGPWDGVSTPPVAVMQRYLRECQRCQEELLAEQLGAPPPPAEDELASVAEAVLLYLEHLQKDPDGYSRADGTLSQHFAKTVRALNPLVALYGDEPAAGFDAVRLERVRKAMLDGSWQPGSAQGDSKRPPAPPVWGRAYVNAQVAKTVRCFRWLESRGIVPAGKTEHLRTLSPLRRGRTSAPESKRPARLVDDADLAAILPAASPTLAAMLQLARMTAMRPGEICRVRSADVERSGEVWLLRLEKHKTDASGRPRVIPLGLQSQQVLMPFLADRPPDAWCFSPRDAARWSLGRRAKREPDRRQQRARQRWLDRFRDHYTQDTFGQALANLIRRVNRGRKAKVPHFSPNDLRHTRLTEIERELGIEAAQAAAGHDQLQTTRYYVHQRQLRAVEAARSEPRIKTPAPDGERGDSCPPEEQGE